MHSDCSITLKSVRLIKPMNKIFTDTDFNVVLKTRLNYITSENVYTFIKYIYSLNATTDMIAINA